MADDLTFDDETLMAFADGELDEATATALETAINADPTLAERVAFFMETRTVAKTAFGPPEPVPAPLDSAVRALVASAEQPAASSNVVDFAGRTKQAPAKSQWRMALAASVASAAMAGVVGYLIGTDRAATHDGNTLAGFSQTEVAELLDRLPSGEAEAISGGAGSLRVVSSFHDQAESLCREFEIDRPEGTSLVAVSCRQQDDWTMRFAVAAPRSGEGYAPASSLDALDAYLVAIDAGPALDRSEEAAALQNPGS